MLFTGKRWIYGTAAFSVGLFSLLIFSFIFHVVPSLSYLFTAFLYILGLLSGFYDIVLVFLCLFFCSSFPSSCLFLSPRRWMSNCNRGGNIQRARGCWRVSYISFYYHYSIVKKYQLHILLSSCTKCLVERVGKWWSGERQSGRRDAWEENAEAAGKHSGLAIRFQMLQSYRCVYVSLPIIILRLFLFLLCTYGKRPVCQQPCGSVELWSCYVVDTSINAAVM